MLESQTPERTLVALTSKMQEKMQKSPKYELVPSFQSFGGYSTDQILTPWYSPLIESCVSWQGPFLTISSVQILHYGTAVISFSSEGIKSSNLPWLQSMATISLINRAWIIQIFTLNLSKKTEEGEKITFFGKDVIIWEFTYYLVTSMGQFSLAWISFLKIISCLPPSTLILSRKLLFHLLKGEYGRKEIIQSQIHLSSLHLWCCSLSSNLLHSGNLCRFLTGKAQHLS